MSAPQRPHRRSARTFTPQQCGHTAMKSPRSGAHRLCPGYNVRKLGTLLLRQNPECRFCGDSVRGTGAAGVLVDLAGCEGRASVAPPEAERRANGKEKSGKLHVRLPDEPGLIDEI